MRSATKSKPKLMGVRDYARHRKCAPSTVEEAIDSERLSKSVTRDEKGRPRIDALLADAEWAATTDVAHDPTKPPPSFQESRARHEAAKAGLAEVKLRERLGELVVAAEVQANLEDVFARCRTKLLGVTSRLRQQLPHLTGPDLELVDSLLREALEDLAENGAGE